MDKACNTIAPARPQATSFRVLDRPYHRLDKRSDRNQYTADHELNEPDRPVAAVAALEQHSSQASTDCHHDQPSDNPALPVLTRPVRRSTGILLTGVEFRRMSDERDDQG
jgi:hypothetical protein